MAQKANKPQGAEIAKYQTTQWVSEISNFNTICTWGAVICFRLSLTP